MPRKSQPGDIRTTFTLPGGRLRMVKAACALEGVSLGEKVTDLLAREYPETLELVKRKRRQPSKLAQMAGAE